MITIDRVKIENVEKFACLGSHMTYDLDFKRKIATRAAKAGSSLKAMDKILEEQSDQFTNQAKHTEYVCINWHALLLGNMDYNKILEKKHIDV